MPQKPPIQLYVDVDGVLLGKLDGEVALARHAREFVDFILLRFDCYWLTSHCQGESEQVLKYLRPYVAIDLLERLALIQPTSFKTLKTEALTGDFYWIDDRPLQAEIADLKARGLLDRLIEIDARERSDDLQFAIEELQLVLNARHAKRM